MNSKILLAFFVCMIAVAVEATYAEESRDDTGIEMEKCDPRFCENDQKCHECCQHNLHVDYHQANGDYDALKTAVDEMCDCYNFVLEKLYGPEQ